MNEHHIRAKVFLAAAERLEGVAATHAVRSAYREAADILKENATSERRLYLAERDSRWLSMDEGRDRIVEAQVNITNNMINMTADELACPTSRCQALS